MDLRPVLTDWRPVVDASAERTRGAFATGAVDPRLVTSLADLLAVFAYELRSRPADPVEYLRAARETVTGRLRRLTERDAAGVVHIRAEDGFDYHLTPRKVLRRELDHLLDHLNQVDQWVDWQRDGVEPVPTDGWASSAQLFDEDRRPLTPEELGAWCWRVDLVFGLLIRRVASLTPAQLDWTPPDGGWTLRRVLYHVGRGFYSVWVDEPLSDEPVARWTEASRRFRAALPATPEAAADAGMLGYGREGDLFTLEEAVLAVLAAEQAVQSAAAGARPALSAASRL